MVILHPHNMVLLHLGLKFAFRQVLIYIMMNSYIMMKNFESGSYYKKGILLQFQDILKNGTRDYIEFLGMLS